MESKYINKDTGESIRCETYYQLSSIAKEKYVFSCESEKPKEITVHHKDDHVTIGDVLVAPLAIAAAFWFDDE